VSILDEEAFGGDQHVAQLWPGDRVEDLASLTGTVDDEPAAFEAGEMVRHV